MGEDLLDAHRLRGERGEQSLGQRVELGGRGLGGVGGGLTQPAQVHRLGLLDPLRRDEGERDDVLARAAAVLRRVGAVAAPPDLGDDGRRGPLRDRELDPVPLLTRATHSRPHATGTDP